MTRHARKMWFTLSMGAAMGLLSVAAKPADATTPEPVLLTTDEMGCAACAKAKAAFLLNAPPPPREPVGRAANLTNTDVLHYDLNIEIIPSNHNIAGHNTITVKSLVDGLTQFEIRLSDTFTINSILVGATPATWTRLDPISVNVDLDRAYNTGEQFAMDVDYGGVASGGGFGSIVWSSSAGLPFVYTLSETWFAYTWWPNKDDNADKATADMTFTIPDTVFLVSNGLLLSDTPVAGNKRQLHYQTNYQTATYLFQFALGDYNTFSGSFSYSGGVMPLEFALLSASDSQAARDAWLKAQDMLPVFSTLFGLYPFVDEKYGIYQFGFGGGMEHQTMTGQGTTSESVTAHELGHQWWGDMTTCALWNDIWLQEGFATYAEALWNEYKSGTDNRTALTSSMSARKPSIYDDSVYVYDATDMNRIFAYDYSYLKGAWVLHMLRGVVGDQDFFDTLAAYRAAYEYGASSTTEFQAIAESVSGRDLTRFFNDWVFQPGRVDYRSAFSNYTINGQTFVEVLLNQMQLTSYPTYEMPVVVRCTTNTGTVDATILQDKRAGHWLIPLPSACTAISIDPNLWILRGNNTSTTYVAGPPKIALASPAPGEVVVAAPPAQITASFHRDVAINGTLVSLVGQVRGPVGASFIYNSPSRTFTLTPNSPLTPDTYTVTILDSVVDASSGKALDGEIVGNVLPSGDGAEGGSATYSFVYAPPPGCAGDLDGDGDTDVFDFTIFTGSFGILSGATPQQGDLDGNGTVDVIDFGFFAGDFGCGT